MTKHSEARAVDLVQEQEASKLTAGVFSRFVGCVLLGGIFTLPGEIQMRDEVVVAYFDIFSLEAEPLSKLKPTPKYSTEVITNRPRC
jgi:hypothetical protein